MARFEESLQKLEGIVQKLEQGELTLEDSVKLFEEGMRLSTACQRELDAAEGRVQQLVSRSDEAPKTEPFPTDDE